VYGKKEPNDKSAGKKINFCKPLLLLTISTIKRLRRLAMLWNRAFTGA